VGLAHELRRFFIAPAQTGGTTPRVRIILQYADRDPVAGMELFAL
jgi:hypothetical protein